MNFALAVIISALVAGIVTAYPRTPQRHHIYYCMYPGEPIPHPYIPDAFIPDPLAGTALPCMYRKNVPVSV